MRAEPPRPIRVLVCALSLRTGGGERYVMSQLKQLADRTELSVSVLATRGLASALSELSPSVRVLERRFLPTPLRILWEQVALPLQGRAYDLVYMPGNFALLLRRAPQIVVLQNATHFGERARRFRKGPFCPRGHRVRLAVESWLARRSVKRATLAIAVSKSLEADVTADLGPRSNLLVVPSARPCRPQPRCKPRSEEPYVLAVAHDYPHKDWDGLVQTFISFPELPPLVLVGAARNARRLSALRNRLAELDAGGRVMLRGPVRDPKVLAHLYARASCYVAHSHAESFGFTPCEALCHGTPIAASDLPAHREIFGGVVRYYDPVIAAALAEAVRETVGVAPPPLSELAVFRRSWRQNAAELTAAMVSAARQGSHGLVDG